MKKSGFTLIEMLAIIIILGILTFVVLPSVFSMVRKARAEAYDVLMASFEDSASLYISRHDEEVQNSLDLYNYYTLTLNDLKNENLIKTEAIKDPRTDASIDLNKKIIITRKTNQSLDVCFEDRVCYIPTLLVNELTKEGNVVSGVIEGLHYDSTNDYYYYRGSNPKNWLEFNGYLWRIVKINTDGSVTMVYEGVKRPSGTEQNGTIGTSAFDAANSNNYNNSLTIKTYLQNWYNNNILSANQSKIQLKKLCIGKTFYSSSGITKSTFLTNECSTLTTSDLPIGLITGKDYLYGSLDTGCLTSYKSYGSDSISCQNSNFLYKSNYNYWTMTGDTTTSGVWGVNTTGSLGAPVSANTSSNVRPVITLINGLIVDKGDGTFENPYILKDIVNVDREKPIITLLGSENVTIYLGQTYSDAGATATDNFDGDISSKIKKISDLNINVPGQYSVTYMVSDTSGNTKIATRKVTISTTYNVSKGVNAPVLVEGMTPIKRDGTTWISTTKEDADWYNYTEVDKKWANARTADGSMWVWIPRYAYRITSGWHSNTAGTIEVQFSMGFDDTRGGTVTLVNNNSANDSNGTWTSHPAFTFGTKEVAGIWVAKFEATASEGVTNGYLSDNTCPNLSDDVTTKNIKIVPNAISWRCIKVGNAFSVSRNMETNSIYGWGTSGVDKDTHLMKNVEWGAVAYLSKSVYGQNSTELWSNVANNFATGCAGNSATGSTTGCLNAYDTTNGIKTSTTGNIYGVYDLSGGAWEMLSAHVDNNNTVLTTNGSSIINAGVEYADKYAKNTTDGQTTNYALTINKKGDAIYETSNNANGAYAWFSDYAYMIAGGNPWLVRGGYFAGGTGLGVYGFGSNTGAIMNNQGFRPVLLVGDGL